MKTLEQKLLEKKDRAEKLLAELLAYKTNSYLDITIEALNEMIENIDTYLRAKKV